MNSSSIILVAKIGKADTVSHLNSPVELTLHVMSQPRGATVQRAYMWELATLLICHAVLMGKKMPPHTPLFFLPTTLRKTGPVPHLVTIVVPTLLVGIEVSLP